MSLYGQATYSHIDRYSAIGWHVPLILTLVVHLFTFIILIFPPSLFLPDRDIEDIQTINLFTVEEFQQKFKPPPQQKNDKENEPPPKDTAQSIAIEPPSFQPAPAKVISLRPRRMKKKITKEPEPPSKEELIRQRALERIQARVNQKEEEQKLKHDLSRLREALHNKAKSETDTNTAKTDSQQNQPAQSSRGKNVRLNETQRRYFIAVQRRILDNWALPKTQDWDTTLQAVVVIYIEKTGLISKTVFEKKSKNVYFNQYVEKTIQAASPMPPIPSDLEKGRLEIGLRFRPSGLF